MASDARRQGGYQVCEAFLDGPPISFVSSVQERRRRSVIAKAMSASARCAAPARGGWWPVY